MAQMCPNCNAANDDTVTFCMRCGTRLEKATDTLIVDFSAGGERERPSWLMPALIGGGVLLCLAVVAIAVGAYFAQNRAQDDPADPTPTVEVTIPVVVPEDTPVPPSPTPEPEQPTDTPEPPPPTDSPPTLTPTPDQPPSPTPNQYGLLVGIQVTVFTTEGDTLRMRNSPGGQVVAQLAKGTLLTIIDGPMSSGGLTWWKLRTSDAQEGWCVEFVDGIQTLLP